VDIKCRSAGTYHYFFTYGEDSTNPEAKRGGCTFLIDPILTRPTANSITMQVLDLNGLQIQTVLSKLLGPLSEWRERLECAKHSGYNMIHFTPVQELNAVSDEPDSAYSIRDNSRLMWRASADGRFDMNDVARLVEQIRVEWGVLSVSDLVFNHVAVDSELLKSLPHAVYNLVNSPHLMPAFVLDRALYHFTIDIAQGRRFVLIFF
jgi:glycogen debranching enzyme